MLAAVIAVICSASFAQTGLTPSAVPHTQTEANGVSAPDLTLGPGDLIETKIYEIPELNETLRISSAGEINLPLVGVVLVGGASVEQAQKKIEQRLIGGGFVKQPHVTILVREFTTHGISVLGEVQRPGYFPILNAYRLMEAVSAAGGLTARAGKTIIVTHRDNSAPATLEWSFDSARLQHANIELHAGDTVYVGRAGVVYVTGDVFKPGGFVLDNSDSLTVLQALALAQGAKPDASLNKARLVRKTLSGPQEITISLKDIGAIKKPDVPMLADDILFIPNSVGKSAGRKTLESIVQITTGILIYRP
ncbi:MAG: polysaccharide biosynthesis/export family protein [Acidobacteriaceae bacterium]